MAKVYVVIDQDGYVSAVFENEKKAEDWVKKGHEEGWLYDEDCSINEADFYSE